MAEKQLNSPVAVFRKALPKLSTPLGKESNFTVVCDTFFGEELIEKKDVDYLKSQKTWADQKRGSELAHLLYENLNNIEDDQEAVKYLLKICEILQESGDKQLKEHSDKMKSHFNQSIEPSDTPSGVPMSSTVKAPGILKANLDISDVNKVVKVLEKALFGASNWYEFGLNLGLIVTTLNVIDSEKGNANVYLRKCIHAWLEKTDIKPHTWQSVIHAVRSTGDQAAAERIPDTLLSLYNIKL